MNIHEAGVSLRSVRYFFTPSSFAEQLLFFPTRVGRYFCDRRYRFSGRSETALQPSHHLHFMLFLVRQGALDLTLDGRHYTAGDGDIVLFDCKRPHEYHAMTDTTEFCWLVLDGAMTAMLIDKIIEQQGGRQVFPAADAAGVYLLFGRLLSCGEVPGRLAESAVSELIYSLLCRLLGGKGPTDAQGESILGRAARFMELHFDAPLSVEEVAAHVGLSASHLTRLFRRQTGYSPHEYLTLRRIDRAKELLLSTDRTVRQIAFDIGYNSEENFIRSFKKKVGVSPTSFRRYPI